MQKKKKRKMQRLIKGVNEIKLLIKEKKKRKIFR